MELELLNTIKYLNDHGFGPVALLLVLGVFIVFKWKEKANAKPQPPAPGEGVMCLRHAEIITQHVTMLAVINNELEHIRRNQEAQTLVLTTIGVKLDKAILEWPKRRMDNE